MVQIATTVEKEKAAQEKALTCLTELKERFESEPLAVFLLDDEEKASLNELLKKLGFYGSNSQIGIKEDVLLFRLNDKGQPGLYYVEDVEHIIDSTSPMIGVVQNTESEELEVYSQGGHWNFERHHKWTKGFNDSTEVIELADYMVDIVNAQLESEEIAEV